VVRQKVAGRFLLLCLFVAVLTGCVVGSADPDKPFTVDRETPPQRLNCRSPWYAIQNEEVGLYTNYCGWDELRQQRVVHLEIGEKVLRMVKEADELIVATFFLFDDLFANEPGGDYVSQMTDLLVAKKRENPSIRIVLILDLLHRTWGYRHSAKIQQLVAAGVEVFYSDVLETRAAQRVGIWEAMHELGRAADVATEGLAAVPWNLVTRIPLPFVFDGDVVTVATIANGALFKANHRKAMVIKRQGVYETLTTSWNPHNPSLLHENHALSVTGPLACYMYQMMREDARRSLELGGLHVERPLAWAEAPLARLERTFPALPESAWHRPPEGAAVGNDFTEPQVAIATEECIEPLLLKWLEEVQPDDRVRIQMFFLSRVPVVNAILDAAARTRHPIEILLDPNRTGISYAKDGMPNAQVADYLLERARAEHARLEIRWYDTHGEQNHAKAMSITNAPTGKYRLCLGSANWTRKNLAGINLENEIFVRNAAELNRQFDALFDRMWSAEEEGVRYSVAWDDPRYHYQQHTGRDNWAIPRRAGLSTVRDAQGRPQLLEQELIHW
jgi:hypothetical protein